MIESSYLTSTSCSKPRAIIKRLSSRIRPVSYNSVYSATNVCVNLGNEVHTL